MLNSFYHNDQCNKKHLLLKNLNLQIINPFNEYIFNYYAKVIKKILLMTILFYYIYKFHKIKIFYMLRLCER